MKHVIHPKKTHPQKPVPQTVMVCMYFYVKHQGIHLLTWFNFNTSMDKEPYTQ